MSSLSNLHLLTQQMHLEPVEDASCPQLSTRKKNEVYTSKATLPNGKTISLLKTLLTSVCERNCNYCPFRSERDFRRATFRPDEFAKLFIYMHKSAKVEGLFLSSGIVNGGTAAQDKLIDTAALLRRKYDYTGYLHLKIMPGVERDQVEEAMLLADRISINLEAPNPERLQQLAPKKNFIEELLDPIKWANEIRTKKPPNKAWKKRWPTTSTQFVVGAAGESDLEILKTTQLLLNVMGVTRAYYSAFNPIKDTPLENKSPTPPIRQNRLYQASYLLRDYGFSIDELTYYSKGNLPLDVDPKLAWAQIHLQNKPIEINSAPKNELIRIPGIGPKGADAILYARRIKNISSLSTLTKIGIHLKKISPFILINGKRPIYQPSLL
jgi:predicted DNA-binding helix-hairpin-helix protein